MSKKKRKGRKHRAPISEARLIGTETVKHMSEFSSPSVRVIERIPPTTITESSERYRQAKAEIKRSLVIGGAMFVLLIVLYLLLG